MITYTSPASALSGLKARIDVRQAQIGVIGLGYVGLPLPLLFTEAKLQVTGLTSTSIRPRLSPPVGPI